MAIMGSHNHLAITFGILGNIISSLVYLAPLPTFYRIYKKKSTEGFQSLPYLVALLSSALWFYYAYLKLNDADADAIPLLTINSFGCVIELIYIITYITYEHEDARKLTIKLFVAMNMGSLALVLFVTHFALHGSLRVKVVGWICVGVSTSVFAAPLTIMGRVIKTKSVQFMPITLSFFLTLSAIAWFLYGFFKKDDYVTYPNVLGFVLGVLQMGLYCKYRKGGEKQQVVTEQALEAVRSIVVVNPLPLGPCEVFPIPLDLDANGQVVDGVNQQLEAKKGAEDAQEQKKSVEANNDCPV
ncbi:Bidirectional sugar transporter SWEET15 [Spatholobus suberectus]|nr:Bidirectional sugar transporter SWEET15 [Spatholobus suberectus]